MQSGWLRSRGPGLALWQAHAVAVRAKAFVARSHVPGLRLLSDGAPPVSMASTEQRKASPAADSGSGKGAAAATLTELPAIYFEVGKGKLSALVTLTAAAGYAMAVPVGAPIMWDMLAMTSGGTMLAAMSASAFNQVIERDNDRRMTRTAKRPLVMGKISPLHGYTAASLAGVGGVALLALQINPVVAALGAANIGLYTSVYTPMKQQTHWNTWMGAVVGAIPPIMGWAAVTGDVGIGALLMGGVLFSWQMPHFLSLAYMMRNDYKAGGYVMLPGEAGSSSLSRATKAAMRHSIYLQVLCAAAPVLGMTDAVFVAEATLLNGGLLYLAYQFHNHGAAGNQVW